MPHEPLRLSRLDNDPWTIVNRGPIVGRWRMTLPEPGRYGVVQTLGLLGWLIRKATHSWANHSFIVGPNGTIIEAGAFGVRAGKLSAYAGMKVAFNTGEEMDVWHLQRIVTKAQSMIGDEYNYVDLGLLGFASLGLAWRLLFRIVGLDKRAVVCSQMVAECGAAAGLDWMCGHPYSDEVTPADLAARPGVEAYVGPLG